MKIPLVLLVLLLAGCVSTQGAATQNSASIFGPRAGDSAPDFTVRTIDGTALSPADLKLAKRPVVLYFFATWCPTCIEDLVQAKQVYPAYEDKVEFIAVDMDLEEDAAMIRAFVEKHSFQPLKNFALADQKMLVDYRITQTSTKYLINRDGVIIFTHVGAISKEDWTKVFESLL